jgi:hypothetical protein
MMTNINEGPRVIVSYMTLRKATGALGVSMPVIVSVGCAAFGTCNGVQDSISDYYGTELRDVFVGVLFAIGLFLFAYRGYERKDDLAGDLACVFALGVALFPTTSEIGAFRVLHLVFAALLFLTLAYFSLFLFTKSKEGVPITSKKKKRNSVYKACGVTMLACIGLIAIYSAFLEETSLAQYRPVFWLEALALWAFGFSWVTKGEMLLKDTSQD